MRSNRMFVLVAACLFIATAGAGAQAALAPSIRVTGSARLSVEADKAILSLAIVQQAKTPTLARQAVATAADMVINAIEALGIERRNIATRNFTVYPMYDDRPGKQNLIVGYRADESLVITIDDVSLTAQLVEAAMGSGATEIRGLEYGKKDEAALKLRVLADAAADARSKAEALAQALGVRAGAPLSIEELGYSSGQPDMRPYMAKAALAESADAFSPGSIDLSAEVSVVFAIE